MPYFPKSCPLVSAALLIRFSPRPSLLFLFFFLRLLSLSSLPRFRLPCFSFLPCFLLLCLERCAQMKTKFFNTPVHNNPYHWDPYPVRQTETNIPCMHPNTRKPAIPATLSPPPPPHKCDHRWSPCAAPRRHHCQSHRQRSCHCCYCCSHHCRCCCPRRRRPLRRPPWLAAEAWCASAFGAGKGEEKRGGRV